MNIVSRDDSGERYLPGPPSLHPVLKTLWLLPVEPEFALLRVEHFFLFTFIS